MECMWPMSLFLFIHFYLIGDDENDFFCFFLLIFSMFKIFILNFFEFMMIMFENISFYHTSLMVCLRFWNTKIYQICGCYFIWFFEFKCYHAWLIVCLKFENSNLIRLIWQSDWEVVIQILWDLAAACLLEFLEFKFNQFNHLKHQI